jgi:hypothetical protein
MTTADPKLERILKNHVAYELHQLEDALLVALQLNGVIPVRNCGIESCCIHARAIYQFFTRNSGRCNDVFASTYTVGKIYTPIFANLVDRDLIKKSGKQIAHITTERFETDAEKVTIAELATVTRPDRPSTGANADRLPETVVCCRSLMASLAGSIAGYSQNSG